MVFLEEFAVKVNFEKIISRRQFLHAELNLFFIYYHSAKLAESESMVDAVKRARPMSSRMGLSPISPVGGLRQSFELPLSPDNTMSSILEEAKRDVKKLKRMKRSTSRMSEAG